MMPSVTTEDVLRAAAQRAGLDASTARLIRDGSNVIYRLDGDVIARIGRPGRGPIAVREVQVSRWLTERGISAVQLIADVPQDIVIGGRPVTWWRSLPSHRGATPAELSATLAVLHSLPPPDTFELPEHDPFVGLSDCISNADVIGPADRAWLYDRHRNLQATYDDGGRKVVIHGDAWQGNLVAAESGVIVLDLEHFAIGRPEWDLVQIAVDYTDFARITEADYRAFVESYGGYDITSMSDYRTFADIQELRWLCFALRKGATSPKALREAHHRIDCLRGNRRRPWRWNPL